MASEEPLLSTASPSSSIAADSSADSSASSPAVLTRLIAALALLAVSLWANHEASKNIDISVLTSPATASRAGRRFDLNFVSNGRANRIIHRASSLVEEVLYPHGELFPRKPVDRIALQLAGVDLPTTASISQSAPGDGGGTYTIHLSPAIISASPAEADVAVSAAVQRAVARVWLWDGQREAPSQLLEAMAEYLATAAGSRPQSSNATCSGGSTEPSWRCWSAEFLRYCETRRRGFVARLNRGMRQRWSEFTADEALGSPVRRAYAAYTAAAEAGKGAEYFNGPTSAAKQAM